MGGGSTNLDTGIMWDSFKCGAPGLGYGNTDSIGDDELPSDAGVVPLDTEVRFVAAGGYHSCAITTGGTVRCWGEGTHGRLGYGNEDDLGDDESLTTLADVPLFAED